MTSPWAIERSHPGEGDLVASLVHRSLPPRLRRFTIWASPRVARYVELILKGAFPSEAHEFYLLRCGRRPGGIAAFRQIDGQAFLNHLWVAPRFRRRSLGTRLLAAAARSYLDRHPTERVALDVFSNGGAGSIAETWYGRLGFRERSRKAWWLGDIETRQSAGCSLPTTRCRLADRQHRAWGFSQFVVQTTGGQRYRVGRLYTPYFRLTEPAAALDAELRQALRILDRKRRLLLIGPESFPEPHWQMVALSRRLDTAAGAFLRRLEARASTGV